MSNDGKNTNLPQVSNLREVEGFVSGCMCKFELIIDSVLPSSPQQAERVSARRIKTIIAGLPIALLILRIIFVIIHFS